MIKQIAKKWRDFWRMTGNVALSMDADPLEDIHRRIRRLEAAVFQSEVGREPVTQYLGQPRGVAADRTQSEQMKEKVPGNTSESRGD